MPSSTMAGVAFTMIVIQSPVSDRSPFALADIRTSMRFTAQQIRLGRPRQSPTARPPRRSTRLFGGLPNGGTNHRLDPGLAQARLLHQRQPAAAAEIEGRLEVVERHLQSVDAGLLELHELLDHLLRRAPLHEV